MLMYQNEDIKGARDFYLFCFTVLFLSWVCLALIGFLLFVPLTSPFLGFGWHKWH